jgi:type I restriction-modification system DNA methylase subunit
MNLFNQKLCRDRITRFDFPNGEKAAQIEKILSGWQNSLRDGDLSKTKEKSIQGLFLIRFFEEVLGYSSQVASQEEWNLIQHPASEVDAQEPDGSLGFFTTGEKTTKAVIELKDAKTLLDKKQSGREKGYTPIEQAYLYATKFDRCSWIIVSNFREIRLYHKNRTQDFFEKFDVLELHKTEEFKRFYYILCKQNLISHSKTSIIDDLANDSTKEDENITLKFYLDYKNARLNLFYHLVEQNPGIEKTLLLEKAQKIIDRVIFILFCEDTGNLLPRNLVKDTYDLGIRSRERSDQRVWREFKNLFMDIDLGRSDIDPQINKYDGGLFAQDDVLGNLVIKDTIWKQLVSLNKYDFESELNVNILGHIFEQSISDIENFKAELLGGKTDNNISRRKQEGIFYTPDFITKYLIEDVVGRFLEENPDKLETIKILDPACGSGAFLNQAHSYLMNEYTIRTEQKLLEKTATQQLDFSDINLAESNRSILLNNLFGVDLNQESVEITKLSLWLKTARSSEPLQNLDKNIKCGNSIVDDPMYAGERAFDWHNEFKNILDTGGFDVIIGNPPYVRQELIKDLKPYLEKNYKVYTGVSDLYVYFFEKALSLLNENGYFAFIVSNKFLRAEYGKKLTQFLQQNFTLLELIDFGDLQIFEGATTYPCIITIQKKKPNDIQRVPLLKLTSLEKVSDLGLEAKENSLTIEIKKNDISWHLRSIEQKSVLDKLANNTIPLGEFVNGQIFSGIKTGFNDAFIIDEQTKDKLCKEDEKNAEIIKPVLRGREIKSYEIDPGNNYIILAKDGIDIPNVYPTIYAHLENFKPELEKRWDKGQYWYNLRPCAYYSQFEKPKIILPDISKHVNFSFDKDGYFLTNTAYLIASEELCLVAILNSKLVEYFYKTISSSIRGGFLRFIGQYLEQIPIPQVKTDLKNPLSMLVDRVLNLYSQSQELQQQALEVLRAEYNLPKITQKLGKFLSLGWNEFIEELEKQRIRIDLTQKDTLNIWFRDKQDTAKNINESLEKLQKEIDKHVYNLYQLNDAEIKLIEREISNY